MLPIPSSRVRSVGNRAPTGPFVLNRDSWQAQGLLFWLPGVDGLRRDASDGNRVATAVDTVDPVVFPTLNAKRLEFDGVDAELDFGTFPFLSAFTIIAWIRPTGGTAGYQGIVSRGSVFENNSNFVLGVRNISSEFRAFIYAKNGSTLNGIESGATGPAAGVVQHIAATWTSGSNIVYRDGVSVASDTDTNGADGSQSLIVGAPNTIGTDKAFEGGIADVRIYDYAMTPGQIAQIYEPATRWDLFYQQGRIGTFFVAPPPTVEAPLGGHTFTGQVPAVRTGASVASPVGVQPYAGLIPSINTGVKVDVGTASQAYTGLVPGVATSANVAAPIGSQAYTGAIPTLTVGNVELDVPAGSQAYTGNAPGVFTGASAFSPQGVLTATGLVPSVAAGASAAAPAGVLVHAGQVPVVSTGVKTTAPIGSQAYAGQVPAVATGAHAASPVGTNAAQGYVPTVSTGISVSVPAGAQAYAGFTPTATTGAKVSVPLGAHAYTGSLPAVAGGGSVAVPLGSQIYGGVAPSGVGPQYAYIKNSSVSVLAAIAGSLDIR